MDRTGGAPAVGTDEYEEAYGYFRDSRDHNPQRYEVLKRCSLMTCLSEAAFAVAVDGLDYSFAQLRRVLTVYPAETGWYQLNKLIRHGAWAAWWHDAEGPAGAGLPAGMAETASRLARHLTGTDGDTAMVERLRLLVLADRHQEAIDEFEKWYPAFENVADFAVCRRLAEAVAPNELRRFAPDALGPVLPELRSRAERRLAMSKGLHEFFEQTRHYVSRRDVEGILESAVRGRPPRLGVIEDDIPPGPPLLIHLHAQGGMGKSTQLAWLVARYGIQQNPPVLSAVLDVQTLVPERLLALPELLLIKAADRFLEQGRTVASEAGCQRMKAFLGNHGSRRHDLDREFDTPGNSPLHPWNAVPVQKSMVEGFADALNSIAQAPVLLCLDTMDEVLQAPEPDLARLLEMLRDLVHRVPRLRVVISGRADVTEKAVFRNTFKDVPWRSLGLKPFTAQEAESYLKLRGVAPEQAERIVAACEQDVEGSPTFTPLVLALLAGSPDDLPATGDSLYLFVVDRELGHIKDEHIRRALEYCAVARHPTYEYFQKVLVPLLAAGPNPSAEAFPDARDLWDRLLAYARRSAWIKAQDTRLLVHVNVRRELRRRMRVENDDAWRRFHRDAAGSCAALADRAGTADEAAGWVAEQVYHELHSAVDRRGDHEAYLQSVAETWHKEVARAWRRGAFATVIDLADRLLSADLETPESEREGLGVPDSRVMPLQLWYDIALERAYGELHAVLYGGRSGSSDVDRYLRLVRRRANLQGRTPVHQDALRVAVIEAALRLRAGLREGRGPVEEAEALLRQALKAHAAGEGPPDGLEDLWTADAQLLLASCRVRAGRTEEHPHLSHGAADRLFTGMFEAALNRDAPQASLIARHAVQDWQLADRPDLVQAWLRRWERAAGHTEDWARLAGAEAELCSGLPLSADLAARSGFGREALRADLLQARSHLLTGEPQEADKLLQEVTLPAVSGQLEPELAFDTLMILARANAQMLELEQAETHAGRAMGRACDDEQRLTVMMLRAAVALSAAGDLGRAHQWIARSAPLREESRGAAGTAAYSAECALLHLSERTEEAEDLLRRWAAELRTRRQDTGRDGTPPTAAEWLCLGLHGLVCGPVGEVGKHLATIRTALESIPATSRRLMLLAEQVRLYGPLADVPLLSERPRADAVERLLAMHRAEPGEPLQQAGLRALWSAELRTVLLGGGPQAVADMRTAVRCLGGNNGQVHATWLRLHRLLPADLAPAPLPPADGHTLLRPTLRAADMLARAHHLSRRRARKEVAQAAGLLEPLTGDNAQPTVWHMVAARQGADVGVPADELAELLSTPSFEEPRRRNLQFALRRVGWYESAPLPSGKADDAWRKTWAAFQRHARGEARTRLRQEVLASAEERPVTQVEVDVRGNALGGAPPQEANAGPVVFRVTEHFLLSRAALGVPADRAVDVILLHGEMRPYDQGAALRLPGSARSIRPEDVDRAVRALCDERRQPPPLLVLDALPQEGADGGDLKLRDLFAFQLHLLGYVPTVLASGPVVSDPDGAWRRAFAHAVAFGRTAHQIAERLQQLTSRHGEDGPTAAPVRLLSHIPEEEMFGIGLL